MHISLNNEWILIIQTPLFSGKIEFLSDVKIFEKCLDFKNGLLYLVLVRQIPALVHLNGHPDLHYTMVNVLQ